LPAGWSRECRREKQSKQGSHICRPIGVGGS
jgi:hypothetical protein